MSALLLSLARENPWPTLALASLNLVVAFLWAPDWCSALRFRCSPGSTRSSIETRCRPDLEPVGAPPDDAGSPPLATASPTSSR